jgi:undecaprenyl diphosphate synthase
LSPLTQPSPPQAGERVPKAGEGGVPRHIAVIMDGNGRWAQERGMPRQAGHKEGIAPVRMCIQECARRGVQALTLFAFSSENWRRPETEVASLMGLFLDALDREVAELHENQVRLRFIGDRQALAVRLQARIAAAEELTAGNSGLQLQVAVSYGGRWDIIKAAQELARQCSHGALRVEEITESQFAQALQLAGLPDPDLFIRTGGERRISNFLLWNLAYTELYFCDCLWPDFNVPELEAALEYFAARERRFGLTAEQRARG